MPCFPCKQAAGLSGREGRRKNRIAQIFCAFLAKNLGCASSNLWTAFVSLTNPVKQLTSPKVALSKTSSCVPTALEKRLLQTLRRYAAYNYQAYFELLSSDNQTKKIQCMSSTVGA